jgi:hypothetical protein
MTIDIGARTSAQVHHTGEMYPFAPIGAIHPAGTRRSLASSAERIVGGDRRTSIVEWIGGATVGTDVAASAIGAAG